MYQVREKYPTQVFQASNLMSLLHI